jgi:hypothetical protein
VTAGEEQLLAKSETAGRKVQLWTQTATAGRKDDLWQNRYKPVRVMTSKHHFDINLAHAITPPICQLLTRQSRQSKAVMKEHLSRTEKLLLNGIAIDPHYREDAKASQSIASFALLYLLRNLVIIATVGGSVASCLQSRDVVLAGHLPTRGIGRTSTVRRDVFSSA